MSLRTMWSRTRVACVAGAVLVTALSIGANAQSWTPSQPAQGNDPRLEALLAGHPLWQPAQGQRGVLAGQSGQPTPQRVMPRGYSVVLVLGDSAGNGVADNVPEAAKKALADMKDFLPYKSYKLLDAAWILGTSATSQLRGVDDMVYSVRIDSSSASWAGNLWNVNFSLDDTDGGKVSGSGSNSDVVAKLRTELMTLKRDRMALLQKYNEQHPVVKENSARIDQTSRQLEEAQYRDSIGSGHQVLETSFSMTLGETVVVGTSRVRGDKALIVLLTSVAEKK